ncbi:M20 family metallopeptidase [Jannaschia sp.]|nr:M20 family metallopeptidase [Jannaschia sp.]
MMNAGPDSLSYDAMHADLAALIGFDTCFPPAANYRGFCDLIEDMSADLGGAQTRITVPQSLWQTDGVHGERINLLLRPDLGPQDAPEALIYFHMDTAPVGDGWTRPPLALTVEEQRLYGRGTADMKGCIAAVLAALRSLKATGAPLAFRPVLAFCTDEEGGLYPGIRHLAETSDLPEILLNLNGGAAPRIWGGCLGSLDLAVTGQGLAVHSGRPDQGINALEEMTPLLGVLADLKLKVEMRMASMAPAPGEGPLRARLNVTAIRAGDKGSALPGTCRLVINRRYTAEEDVTALRAELDATINAALSTSRLRDWQIEEIGHLPPVRDPTGPWTTRWIRARATATNRPVEDFTTYGSGTSSDFGWVQKAGIRHMLLGGLMRPEANVHGPDEHTTKDDMEALARAVALFLRADFDTAPDRQAHSFPNTETIR